MISFKGAPYPKDIILHVVYFYVRYAVFIATLKKFWRKGGVKVDHATLNYWVVRYSSSLAIAAKNRKRTVVTSWRMDETYIKIKIKIKGVYLYRAVDKF